MTRTQIQLPDQLYQRLKEIARQQEWSLTEVIRRAGEQYAERFPSGRVPGEQWQPPRPLDLGETLADPAGIRVEAEVLTERTVG